jgi:hypothetical protein
VRRDADPGVELRLDREKHVVDDDSGEVPPRILPLRSQVAIFAIMRMAGSPASSTIVL